MTLFFATKEHGIGSVENYNLKTNLTWSSKFNNVTEKELFDAVTQRFEDFINSTHIRFFKAGKDGRWSVIFDYLNKDEILKHLELVEQYHRKFGKCYSMRPVKKYRDLGIYYIKFIL